MEDKTQASAKAVPSILFAGQKCVAFRLPMVIVPVLSSRRVSRSPAVSTALPLLVITLARRALSMPAIPIALNNPPIVVGIRHTNKEIKAAIFMGVLA